MFPSSSHPDSALFADLYLLTMAQAYWSEGLVEEATFEAFFREMPAERNYMIAAGLDDVLRAAETLHFTSGELAYLSKLGCFNPSFLEYLAGIRFTGEIWSVPEGTPIFPNEPVVQVVAPLIQGQLLETRVLNHIHFQTVAASKAARVVDAAKGREVVDFGSRRAHGWDAAIKMARAAYLVGCVATSNLQAGRMYGLPVSGTMAHSYIQAHENESQAFAAFAALYPHTTLLVDTYDIQRAIDRIVTLSRSQPTFRISAIRLDSGDLKVMSRRVRQILDAAGLHEVRIIVSSGLDEHRIAELIDGGAPIDGFGVGTRMAVSEDAAQVDMAYKLVTYAGRLSMKLSSDKVSVPGRKQVFRTVRDGMMTGDVVARFHEEPPGRPLLNPVFRNGERLPDGKVDIAAAREWAMAERHRLPPSIRGLKHADPFPVSFSDGLRQDMEEVHRRIIADPQTVGLGEPSASAK